MYSWGGGVALSFESRAYQIGYFIAVAVALGYGIGMIALARRPQLKPVGLVGLATTPAAARWFGLAFVLPALIGLSIAFIFRPMSDAGAQALFAIAYWAAPCAYAGCLLLARTCSNRPVKRAILAGSAPIFTASPAGDRWWNGSTWVSTTAAAPEGAQHSPDGNYWWTGSAWLPMPPIPRRLSRDS
jgi:hypothetical protein